MTRAQIIFVACLATMLLVNGLQITRYSFEDSVMLGTEKHICIPRQYYYLRGRLNFGELFVQLATRLRKIKEEMGLYGSSREPNKYKEFRVCLQQVKDSSGYCPLNSVIALTGELAKTRHQILHEVQQIGHFLLLILGAWSIFPTNFKSPDPGLSANDLETNAQWNDEATDSRFVVPKETNPIPKVYFPTLSSTVSSVANLLPEMFNDQGVFTLTKASDDNDEALKISMELVLMALQDVSDALASLYESTRNMDMGTFPEQMFPINNWLYHWFNIPLVNASNSQVEEFNFLANIVRHLPMTTVKKHANCNPVHSVDNMKQECVLDIITLIPDPHSLINYQEKSMTAHPVQRKDNPHKWLRVKIPKESHLFYDRSNKQYLTSQKPLQCFKEVPALFCSLCFSNNALEKVMNNTCLEGIISKNISSPPCETKETTADSFQVEPKEIVITEAPQEGGFPMASTTEKLTKEIVISNDNPSVLIEKCPNKETSYELPPTARIGLSDNCNFTFVNPPSVTELDPERDYSSVMLPTSVQNFATKKSFEPNEPEHEEIPSDETTFQRDIRLLKLHFKDYGYVYILVTTSSLGFCFVLTISICFVRRQKRSRNNQDNRNFPEQHVPLFHVPQHETNQPKLPPSTMLRPYLLPIEGAEMV
jgi:hypothetical protein